MGPAYIPDRGDVVWIDFSPQVGHEQSGSRPALIISPASYNGKVGLTLLCPITNQIKGYPFEVGIPSGHEVEGVILSDQVKSMDWKMRGAKFCCRMPASVITDVLKKLETLVSFD